MYTLPMAEALKIRRKDLIWNEFGGLIKSLNVLTLELRLLKLLHAGGPEFTL